MTRSTTTPTPVATAAGALRGLALVGGATAVVAATGGTLPFPPALGASALQRWAEDVGPTVTCATLLRAVTALLLGWLVASTVLGAILRRVGARRATGLLDRVSLPLARRWASALAGATVVVSSLAPSAGAAPASTTVPPTAAATVSMHDLGPGPSPQAAPSESGGAEPGGVDPEPVPTPGVSTPATTASTTPSPSTTAPSSAPPIAMQDVGPAVGPDGPVAPWPEVGATGAGAAPAEQPPTAATPPTAVATPSPTDPTWTIRPGDTLWDVAERVRTVRLGRVPTPTETADYLAELVAANASRLAVPGEPDLVFPGQEFVVP